MTAKTSIYLLFISSILTGYSCTKEIPPELQSGNKQKMVNKHEMPDDSIHRKFMTDPHGSQDGSGKQESNKEWEDDIANKITKEADEQDARYQKTRSAGDKTDCIKKQIEAANYLMFEADLPPKEKYKPALQRYRRVLELDPGNKEAIANKEQIEEIYRSLGKPIPN